MKIIRPFDSFFPVCGWIISISPTLMRDRVVRKDRCEPLG